MPWYSWMFDGVGGALLVALCGFLYRKLFRQPRDEKTSAIVLANANSQSLVESSGNAIINAPVEGSQITFGSNISQIFEHHNYFSAEVKTQKLRSTEPTPIQIYGVLEGALPFDRERVAANFEDVEVLWRVRLNGISSASSGCWLVFTIFDPDSDSESKGDYVTFTLTTIPPEIKTAPTGSILWVKGRLKPVAHISIDLKDDPQILKIERPVPHP